MTAAEWIALAGAAGVGSALTAVLNHWLSRRNRRVDLADKTIRIADSLMSRMKEDLDRVSRSLELAQQENEELHGRLVESDENEELRANLDAAHARLGKASRELADLRSQYDPASLTIREINELRDMGFPLPGLGRGLGALIPNEPDIRQRAEDEVRRLEREYHREKYRMKSNPMEQLAAEDQLNEARKRLAHIDPNSPLLPQ